VAGLTADLVTKGTATRNATQIAREVESLGASLSASAGVDSSTVSLVTRSDRADEAFAVFADVARNPAFAEEELERQRQQALDGLAVALRQPGSVARFAMTRAIFGAAPYGGVASPSSLAAVTRAEVAGFHGAHWRPDNAVLVVAGDISADQGFALAERFFGDWPRPSAAPPPEPDAAQAATGVRSIVIDLPDSGQAAVALGLRGLARTDADYFPALVANSVLGGGYSARLNFEIRIKRGLSYGAGSSLDARMAPGPIIASAQTRNDAAAQVVGLVQTEFTRLGAAPVGGAELSARKAALVGAFGRNVETNAGVAGQLSGLALYGLPLDRLQTYVADIEAVTPAAVRAAGARYFDPTRADLVVVGDADAFYDALRRTRPRLERIKIDQLNLDGPELH
jgi:zinc protease